MGYGGTEAVCPGGESAVGCCHFLGAGSVGMWGGIFKEMKIGGGGKRGSLKLYFHPLSLFPLHPLL